MARAGMRRAKDVSDERDFVSFELGFISVLEVDASAGFSSTNNLATID